MTILNRVAAQHDLSTQQVRVLGILRDRRPKMTGLAQREASLDDRRAVRVSLPDHGRALAATLEAQVRERAAGLAEPLSAADRRHLGALLTRLTDGPSEPDS